MILITTATTLDDILPFFNSRTNPGHEGGSIDEPVQVKSQHNKGQTQREAQEQQHNVPPEINTVLHLVLTSK